MKAAFPLLAAVVLAVASVPVAHAGDDHWIVRAGVHAVDPRFDSGHLAGMRASVDSSIRLTGSIEYLATPNWGIEALAALPFKHEVTLDGVSAARTRQLPPVIGVNYHFLPDAKVSPFVGAGLNYTCFFDTKGKGPLQGARVKADDSWGAAAHAGVDISLSPRWLLTADVRWIDIDSDIHVDGAKAGTARIDPWVYGLGFGYRF